MDTLAGWFSTTDSGVHEVPDTEGIGAMIGKKNKNYWVKCYNHDNAACEYTLSIKCLISALSLFEIESSKYGNTLNYQGCIWTWCKNANISPNKLFAFFSSQN